MKGDILNVGRLSGYRTQSDQMCLCTVSLRDMSFHILRIPTFIFIEQDCIVAGNIGLS